MRLFTDGVCIKLLTLLKSRVLHAKSPPVLMSHSSYVSGRVAASTSLRSPPREKLAVLVWHVLSVCQGDRKEVGRSRIPIARTRALNGTPNALSLSRMRYVGALSQGHASVIWRASHSAVGFRVTTIHSSCRRRWPRTRNANSCSKAIVGTTKRSIDAIPSI